jgi:hypothetical protein
MLAVFPSLNGEITTLMRSPCSVVSNNNMMEVEAEAEAEAILLTFTLALALCSNE